MLASLRSINLQRQARLVAPSYRRFFATAAATDNNAQYARVESHFNHSHGDLNKYGQYLMSMVPAHIQQVSLYKNELCLYTHPQSLLPLLKFLKLHHACQFKQCVDVAGVDYPGRKYRFEVVYNLLSHKYNSRLRVKTYTDENSTLVIPSSCEVYPGNNWHEREVYDMYGIFFEGHPDLRRILTDYGFEGYPLRKDFPLTGYTEVRWDEEKKRVITEKLELAQAFRYFDYQSPWEQTGQGKPQIPAASSGSDKKDEPAKK
ncbi:hypothetical protein MP228_012473 [Amoeboaphelidium protococcarum]|nr:hypothetical protein MP228_012473 [Amoeboaphelidium protococcarum]